MAKNIDENIVKMTFDNKDFEKNANHTISVIDKLKSSLDFSKSAKSFEDLEKAASGLNFKGVTDGIKDIANQSLSLLDQVKEKILTGFGLEIGKQLYNVVNNATVGAFKASWSVYEQMISAEQTIMSAVSGKTDNLTGLAYTIEGVQQRLEKLSWYTDETSYNMTQMTNAIANFTSSGIDLDSATQMIIGISNACADAGLNAEKADIAYTAFSKAIGSGAMTLGVWNNQLKTSGLINSERFKQSLLDAGVVAGVLEQGLDGVYKTTKKTAKAGETVSLADMTGALTNSKWMNKAVLEDVLNMYSSTSDALRELYEDGKITTVNKEIQDLTEALASQGKTLKDVGLEQEYTTTSEAIQALKNAYKIAGLEIPKSLAAIGRAQEATTITQALESVRVASSSKWRQIYEEIFGNYEEAKQLWTSLANEAYEWFVTPFDGVIEVLDEWHTTVIEVGEGSSRAFKTTGYEMFSNTLQKIFGNITAVLDIFREALGNIFGEFSVEGIVNLTKGFSNFIDKITLTDKQLGLLRNGLEGLFSILRFFTSILKTIWSDGIKPIASALKPLADSILELFSNIGLLIEGTEETIESSNGFSKIIKNISGIIITVIGHIKDLVDWLNSLFETTEGNESTAFKTFFDTLGNIIGNTFGVINDILKGIGPAIKAVLTLLNKVWNKVKEIFNNISNGFQEMIKDIPEQDIDLSGILLAMFGIDKFLNAKWWFDALDVLKNIFTNIKSVIGDTINSLQWSYDSKALSFYADLFKGFGLALLELAVALAIIASIDENALKRSAFVVAFLAAILGALFKSLDLLNKNAIKANKGASLLGQISSTLSGLMNRYGLAKLIKSIGIAIIELAVALKILSTIDPEQMLASAFVIGALMLGLTEMVKALTKLVEDPNFNAKNMKAITKLLKTIAVGLIEMAIAMKILATIDIGQMFVALIGLAGTLGIVLGFIYLLNKAVENGSGLFTQDPSKKIKDMANAMKGIGFALIEMAAALWILSKLNMDQMSDGLLAMLGIMSIVTLSMIAINKFGGGGLNMIGIAAGMLILAPALILIAGALAILSAIDSDKLWNSVGAITILISVISVLSVIIGSTPIAIAALLALAVSLTVISASMILSATGFLIFAKAIEAFGKIKWTTLLNSLGKLLVLGIGVLGVSLLLGAAAIPLMLFAGAAVLLGKGLVSIGEGLTKMLGVVTLFSLMGENAGDKIISVIETVIKAITAALPAMILGIIDGITSVFTQILQFLIRLLTTLITAVCTAIQQNIPTIIETLVSVVQALLQALTDLLPTIGDFLVTAIGFLVDTALRGTIAAIDALANNIGSLVNSLLNLINSTINALADGIRNNAEGFGAAIANLATAIVDGLVGAIKGVVGGVGDWFMGLFSEDNTEESVEKAKETGMTTVSEYGNAMEEAAEAKGGAYEKANTIEENVTDNMDGKTDATTSGKNTLAGLDAGLGDPEWLNSILERGKTAGRTFMEGYNSELSIASPSKEMKKEGGFTIKGLLLGIEDQFKNIAEAGYTAGSIALESMREAIAESNKLVEDGEMSPVITPVLDLSQVNEGLNGLNGSILQNGELASTIGLNTKTMNGQLQPQQNTFNIDFNIDNGGKDITEADISSWSRKIVQLVNTELGMKMS